MDVLRLGIWVSAVCTLAMFSLLYKENLFYRFFEHLLIGITAGHAIVLGFNNIKSLGLIPLIQQNQFKLVIPLLLGCALYTRYSKKLAWISSVPLAVLIGTGAGLGIKGAVESQFLEQISATFLPLNSIDNFLFAIGTLTTIWYFVFTYKQHKGTKWLSMVGRWTMMITFGASFGNAAMGRLSTLIGRLQFLWGDWLQIIK